MEQTFSSIKNLIDTGDFESAYKKYILTAEQIENKDRHVPNNIKADFYINFACFLFDRDNYIEAFKSLNLAKRNSLNGVQVKQIIYERLVTPNLSKLKKNYETNLSLLQFHNPNNMLSFDNLKFLVLPMKIENAFFLYDKIREEVVGQFVFSCGKALPVYPITINENYDILLLDDLDWNKIFAWSNLAKRLQKNIYLVTRNIDLLLACLPGMVLNDAHMPTLRMFFTMEAMENHFKRTNESLPWNIVGSAPETSQAQNLLNKAHHFRTTPEGRKGDNILLSICIPSYNRGERAFKNISHCLTSCYDEEIQIILSNNGTDNETAQYYEKISQIKDSRLTYFSFDENQGYSLNVSKACELATGRFLLLLSDEDLVDFVGLSSLLTMLRNMGDDHAVIRVKTSKPEGPPAIGIFESGLPALRLYMLSSNYMSGLVLNTKLLKQHGGLEYVKKNQANSACLYYPHIFWEMLVCQYGKIQGVDLLLITIGDVASSEMEHANVGEEQKVHLAYYATLEGRLEQHKGFKDIFMDLEICQNFDTLREIYLKLCTKTLFLIILSIVNFYRNTDTDLTALLKKARNFCLKHLDKIYSSRGPQNTKIRKLKYKNDKNAIESMYLSSLKRMNSHLGRK